MAIGVRVEPALDNITSNKMCNTASRPKIILLDLSIESDKYGHALRLFASFKPNVGIAYAWEPVLLWGGRSRSRADPTVRDWLAENITLRKGLPGAKPERFCFWLFNLLNAAPGDRVIDLFPGTGAIGSAWEAWCRKSALRRVEIGGSQGVRLHAPAKSRRPVGRPAGTGVSDLGCEPANPLIQKVRRGRA